MNRTSQRIGPRPWLGPYTPSGARVRSAVELASDVEGLRLVLGTALGEH